MATVACSTDIESVPCRSLCDVAFTCCTRTCKALCHTCKALSQSKKQQANEHTPRNTHPRHKCDRPQLCSHSCLGTCEEGHECGPCMQQRVKTCIHAQKSRARCCEPMKPCTQEVPFILIAPLSDICSLRSRALSVAMPSRRRLPTAVRKRKSRPEFSDGLSDNRNDLSQPCDRLPCDKRCEKTATCGHQCTSCE
jgi:hypothetical protein